MLHQQLLHTSHADSTRQHVPTDLKEVDDDTPTSPHSKMYHFVCFILLLSLKGIKTESFNDSSPETLNSANNEITTSPVYKTSFKTALTTSTKMSKSVSSHQMKQTQPKSSEKSDQECLISLGNMKEMLLFSGNVFLSLLCLLMLLIIMCLVCKRHGGVRSDKMVVMKSSSGVNGRPSETDIKYSSVKVEIETPDEAQEQIPEEEVGGAAAQISSKENQNSAEEASETPQTSETTPTQEVDQSGQTDLQMEDLEKAE